MATESKAISVVVALAKDVEDATGDLIDVVTALNQLSITENIGPQVEIRAWCYEDQFAGFYRETPRFLIEEIKKRYSPDIIVCVFWSHFGSSELIPEPDVEQEFEQAVKSWRQPEHPRVLIYFFEKTPSLQNDEARLQREYIIRFRGLVSRGEFWWSYKKKSGFRKAPHNGELRSIAYDHLSHFVRNWRSGGAPSRIDLDPPPRLDLPDGWQYLNPEDIAELRDELLDSTRLKEDEAISYFNGEAPSWRIALSESIPRREIVDMLNKDISETAYAGHLRVSLLTGPGGEGKSTILRQVSVDLTEGYPGIHVIWRQKATASLDGSLIRQLLKRREAFVIVSDDAELIAKDVYNQVRSIREESRQNIQFLLASRGTDWLWASAPSDYEWQRYLGERRFVRLPVDKLELPDAYRIVKAWKDVGSEGLGDLVKISENLRAQYLVDLAREERVNNPNEGSFLGAMLRARKSTTFQGYVEQILDRLKSHSAPGNRTLQEVFAYIACLHADNIQMLSRPILRRALSCSWEEFDGKVIAPLADEAATYATGWFILARHRAIAEVAKRILDRKFPDHFDRTIYPDLVRAAREEYLDDNKSLTGRDIEPWNNLPRLYFERDRISLAIDLATVLANVEKYDPVPVVSLAHIFRDANQKDKAADTFRKRYTLVKPDKGYYFEWSVSEGQIGNHCFSTWLCGIALSDQANERRSREVPPMERLSGLTTSLGHLFTKTRDPNSIFYNLDDAEVFVKACTAAAQLGMDIRARKDIKPGYDIDKSKKHLKEGRRLGSENGVVDVHPSQALERIHEGINLAYDLKEKDEGEMPDSLPVSRSLTFRNLKSLFGVTDHPAAENKSYGPPKPRTDY